MQIESVVAMSVYRNDKVSWLISSIDSVLSQTYSNFKFVIYIDGMISDDVRKTLTSYSKKDQRIVLLSSDICKGLSNAMNEICSYVSKWDPIYFFRMDADDVCLETRFMSQVEFMEKNPTIDVLGTSLYEIDENEKRVGSRVVSQNHETLLRSFSRRCPINHPTVCIRYSAFSRYGSYDPSLQNTQDYFLWILMASKGALFANLREPLLKFRRVDGFYKRRGKEKSLNELKARFMAMRELNQWSLFNICYAIGVFTLRMMPSPVIKLAYKLDRSYFHKRATDK